MLYSKKSIKRKLPLHLVSRSFVICRDKNVTFELVKEAQRKGERETAELRESLSKSQSSVSALSQQSSERVSALEKEKEELKDDLSRTVVELKTLRHQIDEQKVLFCYDWYS